MKDKHWTALILAGWALMLLASSFYRHPNEWISISEIHVDDTVQGVSPTVTYSRTIKKKVRTSRLVEVSRTTPTGLIAVCRSEGAYYLDPADVLPEHIDLRWLMGGAACAQPPGEYVIDVVWTIRPVDAQPMEIARTSNFYKVAPHAE